MARFSLGFLRVRKYQPGRQAPVLFKWILEQRFQYLIHVGIYEQNPAAQGKIAMPAC